MCSGRFKPMVFAHFFQQLGTAALIAEEDFGWVAGCEMQHEEDGDRHQDDGGDGLQEAACQVFAHGGGISLSGFC